MEHFDVLIVGAGISGIGAAYHLQTECPALSYAILEARAQLGGTWDLFRYPGVRSDSDMHTLGYAFKPWRDPKAFADGASILDYLRETASEYGIDRHIRYGLRVRAASWSSSAARWTVELETGEGQQTQQLTCNFLFMCSGYYDYEAGYTPEFPGAEDFAGEIVHPQAWTDGIEYAGKRVVVIGSGATAVTLVPELAKEAASVTMLQRSPTYVLALPSRDAGAEALRRRLPESLTHSVVRWKNILGAMGLYTLSKRAPKLMKRLLLRQVREALGPEVDAETHFTPHYDPWDQRMCIAPDGDLFQVLREGRAQVVTDEIERFTEGGIALRSGEELEADLIVTATGLKLLFLGGVELRVDGHPVIANETLSYRAMMFSDVPNLAVAFGYANASWTLKVDLTAEYVCRLLNFMREHGYTRCVPRARDPELEAEPFVPLSSGYVRRGLDQLPKQGSKAPWRLRQNYLADALTLRRAPIDDGVMEFG